MKILVLRAREFTGTRDQVDEIMAERWAAHQAADLVISEGDGGRFFRLDAETGEPVEEVRVL